MYKELKEILRIIKHSTVKMKDNARFNVSKWARTFDLFLFQKSVDYFLWVFKYFFGIK